MKKFLFCFLLSTLTVFGAQFRIRDLPAIAAVTDDDLFWMINDPLGVPSDRKVTAAAIRALFISNAAYDVTWNGVNEIGASKNAIYDALSTHEADTTAVHGIANTATLLTTANISDAAYGAGWDGDTTTAPSKNALYDKIQTLGTGATNIDYGSANNYVVSNTLTASTLSFSGAGTSIVFNASVNIATNLTALEGVFSNGLTLNGVRQTSWPSGGVANTVVGPGAAVTDNAVMTWSGTTGTNAQESAVIIAGGAVTGVTDLTASGTVTAAYGSFGTNDFEVGRFGLLVVTNDVTAAYVNAATNQMGEGVVTNGFTLGGERRTNWPSGTSPTTTRGDMIRRGAAADERVALGIPGARVVSDGTDALFEPSMTVYTAYDEFLAGLTASSDFNWNNTAGGGALGIETSTAANPGIVSASTDSVNDYPSLASRNSVLVFGAGRWIFETLVQLPNLSDGTDEYSVEVGFFDNVSSTNAPTDGLVFVYSHGLNSGNWVMRAYDNTSLTSTNTSIAVVAGSWYKLKIDVSADGSSATGYINGSSIGSLTALPTGATEYTGLGWKMNRHAGTNSRKLNIDYGWIFWKPTTAR